MSIYYDGSHSITFWELFNIFNDSEHSDPIDSWEDLHLIPLTRPDVVVPEPNLRILQIPGTNKRIDITNKLPGKLTFGKRQGQWQFAINHEKYDSWVKSYNRLRSNLHGKRMMFRLNDDPSKIYCGEIVIVGYSPEANYTTVTIQYDLDKGFYNHSDAINPDIPSPSFPDNPSIYISIRFIGRTKNIIETQYKLYGESVTPPEPPEESGYRFRRWNPDIHAVTGNQDYYAQYDVVDNPSPDPGPGPGPTPTPTVEIKGIVITTLPNKLSYHFNDDMDYTGMVVKVLLKSGKYLDNDRYKNGIIPYAELDLSEKVPAYNSDTQDGEEHNVGNGTYYISDGNVTRCCAQPNTSSYPNEMNYFVATSGVKYAAFFNDDGGDYYIICMNTDGPFEGAAYHSWDGHPEPVIEEPFRYKSITFPYNGTNYYYISIPWTAKPIIPQDNIAYNHWSGAILEEAVKVMFAVTKNVKMPVLWTCPYDNKTYITDFEITASNVNQE